MTPVKLAQSAGMDGRAGGGNVFEESKDHTSNGDFAVVNSGYFLFVVSALKVATTIHGCTVGLGSTPQLHLVWIHPRCLAPIVSKVYYLRIFAYTSARHWNVELS